MTNFDWPAIRAAYERGINTSEIARSVPESPTRQAIEKRAKKEGWTVAEREDENYPATERDMVLQYVRNGATNKIAAHAAGISDSTLYRWLQDDSFKALVTSARAAYLAKHIGNIDQAGERDWKASAYLLERSPETRDQYGHKQDSGGLVVVLNINRGDTIEGIHAERIDGNTLLPDSQGITENQERLSQAIQDDPEGPA